jgi:hypothetical protein
MAQKRTKKVSPAKLSPAEAFIALPDAEKDRIVAEFDRPFAGEKFGPLTPEMRERVRRAKRKVGRPRVGKGAVQVSVAIERDLLKQAEAFRKRKGITRSELFVRGLKAVLGVAAA